MRADVFLAGAVAMVNRNFGAPLIMTFHSRVVHALNSESTYLELSKLTQFSRSETENSEFPISE